MRVDRDGIAKTFLLKYDKFGGQKTYDTVSLIRGLGVFCIFYIVKSRQ